MDSVTLILVGALGLALTLSGWAFGSGRRIRLREQLNAANARVDELVAKLSAVEMSRSEAQTRMASAEALALGLREQRNQLEQELRATAAAKAAADEARARSDASSDAANQHHAGEINRLNNLHVELKNDFEKLARSVFNEYQGTIKEKGEQHQKDLQNLLRPIEEQLKRYEEDLKNYDTERRASYVTLKTEIENLIVGQNNVAKEASRLANALSAGPKVKGRWGEQALRNIIELAGMSAHADFSTQVSVDSEEGRLRPDLVLRLPGGRILVVDSKFIFEHYLAAVSALNDEERENYLSLHARAIRRQMESLGSKKYWAQFKEAPDYVVMFIPGENFLAAAAERDPDLFEDAFSRNVIITTPATMVALAKAVAYGWRQEKAAADVQRIGELGRTLYSRLATMGDHVLKMGRALSTAVDQHNEFVGSLESSVMPQARRFVELSVVAQERESELKPLPPIDKAVREPVRDRDLRFEGDEEPALPLSASSP